MKTLISKLTFILLLLSSSGSLFAHVELDYPQGGETFTVGQTINIQWTIAIAHNTLNWDLLYSLDGGNTWDAIQMDLPAGSLSYNWIVPSNITSQARVSVIQDNSAQDYQDESPDFSIVAPPVPPAIVVGAMDIIIESNVNSQEDDIQDWLTNHGGATATSSCGDLVWQDDFFSLSDQCGYTGSALVTFTVTDACGSTETVATVTVNDSAAPILNTPASPLVVECDGNGNVPELILWLENNGEALASDAGGSVSWSHDFPTLADTCSGTINQPVIFTATDECGNSITTEAIVTIIGTSGTFTPSNSNFNMNVSPNPVSDMLKVDFENQESLVVHFTLFDAIGNPVEVYQESAKEMYLPVHGFTPGLYYLQARTPYGVATRKVIIQ